MYAIVTDVSLATVTEFIVGADGLPPPNLPNPLTDPPPRVPSVGNYPTSYANLVCAAKTVKADATVDVFATFIAVIE